MYTAVYIYLIIFTVFCYIFLLHLSYFRLLNWVKSPSMFIEQSLRPYENNNSSGRTPKKQKKKKQTWNPIVFITRRNKKYSRFLDCCLRKIFFFSSFSVGCTISQIILIRIGNMLLSELWFPINLCSKKKIPIHKLYIWTGKFMVLLCWIYFALFLFLL